MSRTETYIIAGTDPELLIAALAVSNRVPPDIARRATMVANGFAETDSAQLLRQHIPGELWFHADIPWQDPPNGTQAAYDGLKSGRIPFPVNPPPAPAPPPSGGGGGGLLLLGLAAAGLFFVFGRPKGRRRR